MHHHLRGCLRPNGQTHQGSGESVTRAATGQLQPLKDTEPSHVTEPDNPKPSAAPSHVDERGGREIEGPARRRQAARARAASASRPAAPNRTKRITTASRSPPPCRAVGRRAPRDATRTHGTPPVGPSPSVPHGFSLSHSARGRTQCSVLPVSGRGGAQAVRVACRRPRRPPRGRRSPAHVGGR